jgi:hypothetical protein
MSNFDSLDRFTKSYIVAALWSETISRDDDDEHFDEPFENRYSGHDIHPDSLKKIVEDCNKFRELAGDMLCSDNCLRESGEWNYLDLAGHDFWLTRNGHGTGFWDCGRWDDSVKDKLSDIANKFSECYLYIYDGMVRFE